MNNLSNQILVNGPIICLRLEGYVNSIKKVIYLFGDNHSHVNSQTKCPTHKSKDFVQYFAKTMSMTNKKINYDLFFEIMGPKKPAYLDDKYKDRYIEEITKYFELTINVVNNKDNKKKDKNIGSKEEPNLRLHHIDIRNAFFNALIHPKIEELVYFGNKITQEHNLNEELVKQMEFLLDNLKTHMQNTTASILKEKPIKENLNDYLNTIYSTVNAISHKILKGYHNKNVKNILINKTQIINMIKTWKSETIKECTNLKEIINKHLITFQNSHNKIFAGKNGAQYGLDYSYVTKCIIEINNSIEIIYNKSLKIYVLIMDMYFLRRFLDKDYITHTISYTGWLHTFNYLFMLVKYFGFQITHTTHLEMKPNKIEKMILGNEYNEKILAKIMPTELFQCIDMTNFPPNFE